jgi:hypothetical protein
LLFLSDGVGDGEITRGVAGICDCEEAAMLCVLLKARKSAGNQAGRRVSSEVDVLWGWRYFKYSEIMKRTIKALWSFARKREGKEKKSGWFIDWRAVVSCPVRSHR